MKRQQLVVGILSLIAVFLSSCGGDSNGHGTTPPPTGTTAPSGLQYPAHSAYTIQQAITPLTPTVSGQVTSYSISPSLPAGLSFSTATGVISGTPTMVAASAAYSVTATNDGGSTTATVSIAVNDAPPTVHYASPYYAFTANVATQAIKPTVGGGAITSWSVNPALPTGLTLSSTDGTISGVPTAGSAPTVYTVTATNSGGPVTVTLTIAVAAAPLIDLVHISRLNVLRGTASRVLSSDSNGHWVLQNYASGASIAQGDYGCPGCWSMDVVPVDIRGSVMLDYVYDGGDSSSDVAELRSADDGHLLAKIAAGGYAWRQLASDGTYLAAGNKTVLMVWSPSGQVLISKTGEYSGAQVVAAPGQLLVAMGAAGQNVIETISVPTGTSSLSPTFQGQFASWFPDGTRFLTTQGNSVWTYSSAAVQQDVGQLANAAPTLRVNGTGNYVWTFDVSTGKLSVYPVGATSAPPVFTGTYDSKVGDYDFPAYPVVSGNTLAAFNFGSMQITAVDLSGVAPTSTSIPLPVTGATIYAAIPGGAWVVGTNQGVIVDGASLSSSQPRFLSQGKAWSIVGGSKYFSVAIATGSIFTYDNSNNTLVSTINFPAVGLAVSSSGAVLAALSSSAVNVYSVPGGTATASYPYTGKGGSLALSAAGDVLLAPLVNTSSCTHEAINLVSGAALWCVPGYWLALSPDGTSVSAVVAPQDSPSTKIYQNGVLSSTVAAIGVGWFDNNRLLANHYGRHEDDPVYYFFAEVIDPEGHSLSGFKPPQTTSFDVVTSDSIYALNQNAIYSLTDGSKLWASGNPSAYGSAVSGSQVVFVSGTVVLAQPH